MMKFKNPKSEYLPAMLRIALQAGRNSKWFDKSCLPAGRLTILSRVEGWFDFAHHPEPVEGQILNSNSPIT